MKGHGEKFTRKQEAAIIALLNAPNIADAAKNVGINESTLSRWLKDETFQERYRAARSDALQQAITQLQNTACSAVIALKEITCDKESPASSRVAAARTILEMAFKTYEFEDLECRIVELENFIEKKGVMDG